jgi:hypothetical protein
LKRLGLSETIIRSVTRQVTIAGIMGEQLRSDLQRNHEYDATFVEWIARYGIQRASFIANDFRSRGLAVSDGQSGETGFRLDASLLALTSLGQQFVRACVG